MDTDTAFVPGSRNYNLALGATSQPVIPAHVTDDEAAPQINAAESGLAGGIPSATPPPQAPTVAGPATPAPEAHVSIARHVLDALSGNANGDPLGWAKSIVAGGLAGAANVGTVPPGGGFLTGVSRAAAGVNEIQRQKALDQQRAAQVKQEMELKQKADARAEQELQVHLEDAKTQRAMWNAQTLASTQARQQNALRFPTLQREDQLRVRELEGNIQKSENESLAVLSAAGVDISKLEHITRYDQLTGAHGKQVGAGDIFGVPNGEEHKPGEDGAGAYLVPGNVWEQPITEPVTITTGYDVDPKTGKSTPRTVTAQPGTKVGTLLAIAKGSQVDLANKQKQILDQATIQEKRDAHQEALANIDFKRAETDKTLSEAGLGGLKPADPVIGFDAKGNQILTSAGQAKQLELHDVNKADTALVEKASIARSYIPLNNELLKDIDELDKAGKLGVLGTRWNEFLAGKVGNGDPLFEKFRVDSGLANTQLMQFHVGNRGGAYMLEHFQDLANQKKLNAATLRAGIKEEGVYAAHRAMMTDNLAKQLTGTQLTEPAPGTHVFDSKAWSAANPGKDVNAAIAQAKQQGYEVKE